MVESLGGDMGLDEGKYSSAVNMKKSNHESKNNIKQTHSYSNTEPNTRDLLLNINAYSVYISNADDREL